MDMIDAAQDAYEETLEIEEALYSDSIENARESRDVMSVDELLDEMYDCRSDVAFALGLFDKGELTTDNLGLLLVNLRNAAAMRDNGVPGALRRHEAASLAILGFEVKL